VANWEIIKKVEKGRQSVTDGIPASLPALALAAKLARKASSVPGFAVVGFDDERARAGALLAGLPSTDGPTEGAGPPEVAHQVGDLLWILADLGRRLGVDAEDVLRATAQRFRRRLQEAEQRGPGRSGP
jgi:nucleoside triphosphate diphosphatase